jgi:hypothetical protein
MVPGRASREATGAIGIEMDREDCGHTGSSSNWVSGNPCTIQERPLVKDGVCKSVRRSRICLDAL